MTDTTYNGWKNYATWRINLEIVGDQDFHDVYDEKPEEHELADYIKDTTTEFVSGEDYDAEHLTTQYALAFLDTVDWQEIAEHILSDWED